MTLNGVALPKEICEVDCEPDVLRLWPSDNANFQLGLAKLRCIVDEFQVANLNGDAPGWHASSDGTQRSKREP